MWTRSRRSLPPSWRKRQRGRNERRCGSAGVLALDYIAVPVAGDDEVLIRVRAAVVGPDVWHLMTGRPYMVRLMGNGLRRPKTRVPGWMGGVLGRRYRQHPRDPQAFLWVARRDQKQELEVPDF